MRNISQPPISRLSIKKNHVPCSPQIADNEAYVFVMVLSYHRQLPRIAVDALRFAFGDDKCVAEEDVEPAVGGGSC